MLVTLLKDEITALTELLELLNKEYVYLQTHDTPKLEQLVGLKEHCTTRLQRLVDRRVDYILQRGFGVDAAGIEGFIDDVLEDGCDQARIMWERLRKITAQAKQQNEINGAVIAGSRSHVEAALAILRGGAPQACLYNQDAQPDRGERSRVLARA